MSDEISIKIGDRRPITIWRFGEATEEYRALSTNGGDEDYIARVPKEYDGVDSWLLTFLDEDYCPTWFARCGIDKFTLEDGDSIYIGSHA